MTRGYGVRNVSGLAHGWSTKPVIRDKNIGQDMIRVQLLP
jgi:hypothetical protein